MVAIFVIVVIMNLNQSVIQKKRAKNGFGYTAYKPKQIMGPPSRPPLKNRNRLKSNSTQSSGTNWGKSCHSVINTSTLRSASTTISSETESRVIAALTEGRGDARCEVGLASIDLSMPTLLLCQISDSQSYINTLTKINILNPTDIVVPTTFLDCNNRLIDTIRKKFPNIKILGIPRKSFNKSNGMDRILQLCLPSINTICVGLQHKYYALAAAAALTTYLQNNLNIYYAKESINVSYQESEGYAVIDVSTADRLELVSSTKPAQATRFSTLFGVLNYCVTKVGARLLRSTILQPPSSPSIIESTSQCVAELIKHPEVLLSIQTLLNRISNIDQLLTLTSMTLGTTDSCSVRQLNYLLLLNGLIDLIEPLKDIIERCQQPFFKEMKTTLESDNFAIITNKIRTMIHPSAQFAKSEAGVTQRCFAIKSNINGLLDLVRKTYSERLNDLTEYVRCLGNKYNLPLTLGNNNTKGYHIVLKLTNQQKRTFKKSDLPTEFIQVFRLAASITMKTAELINLSTRLDDIMLEILKISNSMVYNIIVDLKQYLGFFYKLCEDVARLDMLQSLTEASRRGNYTKPKFGDFTELINARHPILEMLIGDQRVANSISICPDFNVQVITGPNGSGKSIYIRQVMLLQVMAQVGCYVPADCAMFRPMSRMFARIYLEDDMEYGASSFILEMKEVKYMMTLLSEKSLFIIDELCRSTSAEEGAALAMAICEKFCSSSVFLYVTTHYTSLANLANMYFNVKTWQMETIATGDTPQELSLDYKFRLIPGVTNLKQYGVYVVKKIWPESILNEVYRILDSFKKNSVNKKYVGVNEAIRLKYKLESDLRKLKSVGKLTIATLNTLLNDYQNELQRMNLSIDEQIVESNQNEDYDEVGSPEPATSSYQDLSNFLREDSDNINKLIPEVTLACSERELLLEEESVSSQINSDIAQDSKSSEEIAKTQVPSTPIQWGTNTQNLSNFLREDSGNIIKLIPDVTLARSERELLLEEESVSSQINNSDVAQDSKSSEDISKTQVASTPIQWGTNIQNLSEIEMKSIIEELESASQSFLEEDEDFDFSQASSYQTAASECDKEENGHIFPVVTVLEGPDWSSDSSCSTLTQQKHIEREQSISYSPVCSQSSDKAASKNTNIPVTSTSSSLHFLSKNAESVVTSDTNLANISTLRDTDNITVENLKSLSVEKTSSDEHGGSKTTSSLKESDKSNDNQPKNKKRPKKFIPPKKLSRREIQEEFDQQDRKIFENDIPEPELPKYLSQILNRPSVRQLQRSQHLAFVRKTDDGVEVIPAKPQPVKKFAFKRNLSSSSNIDMSIFSDKNAKCFDEFLNSEERDVKRFKFNCGSQKANPVKTGFNFQPQSISEYAGTIEAAPFCFKSQNSVISNFYSLTPLTPDGYYKQNKEDINNIVNKYLQEESEQTFRRISSHDSNIFETCSLNENDLDL